MMNIILKNNLGGQFLIREGSGKRANREGKRETEVEEDGLLSLLNL